jgi:hypothetical protein
MATDLPNLRRFIHRKFHEVESELRSMLANEGLLLLLNHPSYSPPNIDKPSATIYVDEEYIICMIRIIE